MTRGSATVLTPALMREWAVSAAEALAEHAQQINDLNVFPVPDADTGTNSSLTFQAGLDALEALPAEADVMTIARAMGRAAALGARGNSGVILSQMLRGMLDAAVDPSSAVDASAMARVLQSAADAGRDAVADPRDGTMLTVAADAAAAARTAADAGATLVQVCTAAADAARASLIDTPNHLVELAHAGVVDAGGRAIVVVLDALAEVVTGTARPQWTAPALTRACDFDVLKATYRGPAYEVMYVLNASARAVADAQSQLVNLGDSLAVVGGDGLWNVHVHVDDPSTAIAIGRAAGELQNVRVSYLLSSTVTHAQLVVMGVTGELGDLASQAGALVIEEEEPERARERLAQRIGDAPAVLIACHGPLAGLPQQWWRDGLKDSEVAVVACPHAAQIVAALAVCDVSLPMTQAAASMAAAVAAMRCGAVVSPSSVHAHEARWSLPGWRSGSADDVQSAFLHIVTALVRPDSEAATVVVSAAVPLSEQELRATLADAAPECDVLIVRSQMTDVAVCLGVE